MPKRFSWLFLRVEAAQASTPRGTSARLGTFARKICKIKSLRPKAKRRGAPADAGAGPQRHDQGPRGRARALDHDDFARPQRLFRRRRKDPQAHRRSGAGDGLPAQPQRPAAGHAAHPQPRLGAVRQRPQIRRSALRRGDGRRAPRRPRRQLRHRADERHARPRDGGLRPLRQRQLGRRLHRRPAARGRRAHLLPARDGPPLRRPRPRGQGGRATAGSTSTTTATSTS